MAELIKKQHVFRLGDRHNKWLVVIPTDVKLPGTDVGSCRDIITEVMRSKHDNPVTHFDHIEYLGFG